VESKELREQLIELHKALEDASHKAPEGNEMLSRVMTDIVRIASGDDIGPDESDDLHHRLQHQVSDFEVRHPRLAGILREVTDILAKLGI